MKMASRLLTRAAGVAALAGVLLSCWSASALAGYSRAGKLNIVSEPGETSADYVQYYKDGQKQSLSKLNWVDQGKTGKAVQLDGKSEYLQVSYNQLKLSKMSFAGWFYWKGAASDEEGAQYGQRFFTMSRGEASYLTVSPHMRDAARADSSGRILDGLYFGFHHGGDDAQNKNMEYWKPAVPGRETYAIPQGEWHHIAVVSDQKSLKLYIDGVLYYNRVLIMGLVEMKANKLTVGSGIWDDPTLNALIDDVALYEFALTGEQVLMLARGVDPLSSGASVPATEAPYIPEAPTATSPASVPDDGGAVNHTILGLPAWTVYLIIGVVAVFIVLSVVLSITQPKNKGQSKGGGAK